MVFGNGWNDPWKGPWKNGLTLSCAVESFANSHSLILAQRVARVVEGRDRPKYHPLSVWDNLDWANPEDIWSGALKIGRWPRSDLSDLGIPAWHPGGTQETPYWGGLQVRGSRARLACHSKHNSLKFGRQFRQFLICLYYMNLYDTYIELYWYISILYIWIYDFRMLNIEYCCFQETDLRIAHCPTDDDHERLSRAHRATASKFAWEPWWRVTDVKIERMMWLKQLFSAAGTWLWSLYAV